MKEPHTAELDQLRAMVSELAGINEIVSAVSGRLAIQQITEILIDKTLRHLRASQGAVLLATGAGGAKEAATAFARESLQVTSDLPPHLTTFVRRMSGSDRELPLHLNRNLSDWILKHKRLLVINAPDRESPFPEVDLPSLGIQSLLAAPLRLGDRVIGILSVFNKQDPEGFTKQDERFVGILGAQCSQALEAARLYEEERNLDSLRRELQIARDIQRRFLPQPGDQLDPRLVCGFNLPAREVGGDFYDLHRLPDGRVFLSVGDVCGKGMPAALLMSNVVAIQRSHLSRGASFSLVDLVDNINSVLCHFIQPGQFVCGIFAVYDPRRRVLELVNAGHPPPLIIGEREPTQVPGESGLLLGVLKESRYATQAAELPAGAVVCFYTDGITEAFDEEANFFGEDRLQRLLLECADLPAGEICHRIQGAVAEFQGGGSQADDITAVLLKVAP